MAGYIGSKTVSLSTTAANVEGNITVTGNVDGRDVSVDGTKLDTIPVISTSSVPSFTAKSDGTTDGYIQLNCSANSHGIKLKSPPHSAGASYTLTFPNDDGNAGQFLKTDGSGNLSWGTDATLDNTKLPLAGGAMTGAITTNSTFDGRNVSSDGTKLDGIQPLATVDQTDAEIKTAVQNSSDIALAGNPTTTTQNPSNNSTRVATTAYTDAAITALVNSAPVTLDTLNELAAALDDDPNYAATTATLIGSKMPKSGGAFTGAITGTTASFTRLDINASNTQLKGDLFANTDGAFDIGASGANRPRNLYISNSISAADITTTGAGIFGGTVTADGLTVDGNLVFPTNTAYASANSIRNNSNALIFSGGTSGYYFNRHDNSATDLSIDSSGNIGIGTSSIDTYTGYTTLSLSNTIGATIQFEDDGVKVGEVYNGTDYMYIGSATAGSSMRFGSGTAGEAMRITSSGNVGIAVVPETWHSSYDVLQISSGASIAGSVTNRSRLFLNANTYINTSNQQSYIATDEASQYWQNGGTHIFNVAASGSADSAISWNTAMTINNSGNVGIGCTPSQKLHVYSSGQAVALVEGVSAYQTALMLKNNYSSVQSAWHLAAAGGTSGWGSANGNFIIRDDTTNSTGIEIERGAGGASGALYIDSSGLVLIGKTGSNAQAPGIELHPGANQGAYSTISSGNTWHVNNTSAYVFYVANNGGVKNFSANNVNLSDRREKKNIELLDSQWDSLKQWSLKKFHYNADDDSDNKKYGVIAQEVEIHNPEVIGDFNLNDDTTRMAVKEQQMMWLAIKALQEAQTRIEELETKVAALEAN